MAVIILQSEAGAGKTWAACGWREPIRYLNLEDTAEDVDNRLDATVAMYYSDCVIYKVHLRKVYEKPQVVGKVKKGAFELDGIGSLKAFTQEVDAVIQSKSVAFESLVVDGISDLRDFAHDLWCYEHGREHAVNPGDWSEVNDIIRDKLQPLIHVAKRIGFDLVMTAQYKDDYAKIIKTDKNGKKYEESVKVGRIANYKEWQAYGVGCIIDLVAEKDVHKKPTGKYFANCEKSIAGAWSENITDRSLFELLVEKGITHN